MLSRRRVLGGVLCAAVAAAVSTVSPHARADAGGALAAVPVRLIVGYKPGADAAGATRTQAAWGALSRTASASGRQALAALGAQTLQVPAGHSAGMIAALRSDPNVAYVEVDHVLRAAEVTPDDPMYAEAHQPEMDEVKVPAAWQITTGSPVTIAVVDSGVTAAGDLAGAVLPGYDFVHGDTTTEDDLTVGGVVVGHGTTVASLIAARGGNGEGMAGVCWSCQILPVKVLDSNGLGDDSTVAQGIVWAVQHGARIVNLSLGGPERSTVVADAVAYATMNSVLVVAAAGNDGTPTRSYPAAYDDVLAVGATARGVNTRAEYSNYNSTTDRWVDVAAPGKVTGMDPGGNYSTGQEGTSFAAPIVSGIAGLIKSNRPEYTGWSLMNAVQQSATPIGGWVTYGEVDAATALTVGTDTAEPTSTGISPAQNAKRHGVVTVAPVRIADDRSGIRNVTLYVDGAYKGYSRTSPFSVTWNSAGRNGPVRLQLRIYDKAGNHRFLDRTIIADNTPPAVRFTKAPKNKARIRGTVKISATASDRYGVSRLQLLINGKVVSTRVGAAVTFSFKATRYPRKIGVQVRAYDIAGNLRTTAKLSYHR